MGVENVVSGRKKGLDGLRHHQRQRAALRWVSVGALDKQKNPLLPSCSEGDGKSELWSIGSLSIRVSVRVCLFFFNWRRATRGEETDGDERAGREKHNSGAVIIINVPGCTHEEDSGCDSSRFRRQEITNATCKSEPSHRPRRMDG